MRAALVALALVTAVSAVGCGASKRAAVVTTVTVTTTTTTATSPAAPTLKPVPAGFDPVSFTAISADEFWLLGNGVIARTVNGGKTFAALPAPPLPASSGLTPELRFADRNDGFAFATGLGGALYATHDAGATWNKIPTRTILAFATGDHYAFVVSAQCATNGCSDYRLERAPVSSDAWTSAPLPFTPDGSVVDLAAHGSSVWFLGTAKGSEPGNDTIARSTDAGKTFTTGSGPCVPGLGGDLEPSSDLVVWAVCPTGMEAGAWISTDGGVTFGALKTPELVNSARLAPASDATAVLAQGAQDELLPTTDGGTTWTSAHTPGASFVPFVGFTDANVGAALAQGANGREALWRTTDGGADWAVVPIG
ncbi:MAG TPA: hypothetical protein VHV52_06010 [Gaiellaceae bacterium]|nr:hypothetical protein [Gaiellaceae bacterium]